jgi:hypothetical protein
MDDDRITVENVNTPGRTERVNRAKYQAMHSAMLAVLPKEPPGLTAAEIGERVKPMLPERHFPGGKTAGWWVKCVQLDLEAKGVVTRARTKPLRFSLA